MDFEALKEQLKNTEIKNFEDERKKKKKEVIEELSDYYSIPIQKDAFNGNVIKLSGEEFNAFYQNYHNGRDAYSFREKLHKMDEWFFDKPYKVQQNWMNYIARWMSKDFYKE